MATGKLLIRATDKIVDGKKTYIVCGVLSFDNDPQTEKLYTVEGGDNILFLSNPADPPIDISGMRIDQILTSKIWQV